MYDFWYNQKSLNMIFEGITTIIFILIAAAFYKFYIKPSKKIQTYARQFEKAGYKVYKFPFNPFNLPLFKTILNDSKKGDPFKTYKEKFFEYDIIVGNIFSNPALSFISPSARKQFIKHEVDYSYIKVPFIVAILLPLLGKGLVFSEGEQWKRKRRIFSSFFTYEFLSKKVPDMVKTINDSLDENEKQCESKDPQIVAQKKQYQFHLIGLTSRIFSNIILSLFLGTESLEQKVDGKKLCHFTIDLISQYNTRSNDPVPIILGSGYIKMGLTALDRDLNRRKVLFNKWASNYIDKVIEKTSDDENKGKSKDLLQLLYNSKKNDEQHSYSKQQLIDELKVFSFAGTDTTSHLLQMMIYLTVKHGNVYSEVMKQINDFKGQISCVQDLKKLKYIEAIIKQTTRYYGPLPVNFPRVTVKDHLFSGVPVSKGTTVQYHSATTHYDPKYYEEPFQFRPERWLAENKQLKQYDGACLTGFGMGPRSCIGQQLAHIQAKIAFFYFFRRYTNINVPDQIKLRWRFMNEAENLWIKVHKI